MNSDDEEEDCGGNKRRISPAVAKQPPLSLPQQWMSSRIIMLSFMVLLLCQCMSSSAYERRCLLFSVSPLWYI